MRCQPFNDVVKVGGDAEYGRNGNACFCKKALAAALVECLQDGRRGIHEGAAPIPVDLVECVPKSTKPLSGAHDGAVRKRFSQDILVDDAGGSVFVLGDKQASAQQQPFDGVVFAGRLDAQHFTSIAGECGAVGEEVTPTNNASGRILSSTCLLKELHATVRRVAQNDICVGHDDGAFSCG